MVVKALIMKYLGYIIGVLLAGGILWGGWAFYNNLQDRIETLSASNERNENKLKETESRLEQVREDYQTTLREQSILEARSREAEEYNDELLRLLRNHDLTRLSRAKPGLIQNRVNNATEEIFKELESITASDD